jgi:hypothetical protein
MSDAFRKDFHTKVGEKMVYPYSPFCVHSSGTNIFQTPDSSKSTLTKAKESLTGSADKVARGAQPGTLYPALTWSLVDTDFFCT